MQETLILSNCICASFYTTILPRSGSHKRYGQQWNRTHGSRFNLTRRHINMPQDVTQLQRHSYSDTQSVSLSCFKWITVENISGEGTGEARWQIRGILLKLQHVDIHVHHLPSLSSSQRSLCLSLQPSSSIKVLRWQKITPF